MPTYSAIATSVVTLLNSFLPLVNSTGTVGVVLNTLSEIIPLAVKEATDLVPVIKNIINSLSSHPDATSDQLVALAALDAMCDADFEDAAKAAGFEPDAGV